MTKIQRPEALAQFAESARRGEREGVAGLTATNSTAPIPVDSRKKDEAATRILAEGATGRDFNSEEAVDELPDRILESRDEDSQDDTSTVSLAAAEAPYDATRDPRTGRPPNPLEAQRLARDNELERLSRAQSPKSSGLDPDVASGEDEGSEAGIEEVSDGEPTAPDEAESEGQDLASQAPARMASPALSGEEVAAGDDLVGQGVARERAEELVRDHGTDPEVLATFVGEQGEAGKIR